MNKWSSESVLVFLIATRYGAPRQETDESSKLVALVTLLISAIVPRLTPRVIRGRNGLLVPSCPWVAYQSIFIAQGAALVLFIAIRITDSKSRFSVNKLLADIALFLTDICICHGWQYYWAELRTLRRGSSLGSYVPVIDKSCPRPLIEYRIPHKGIKKQIRLVVWFKSIYLALTRIQIEGSGRKMVGIRWELK